MKTEIKSSYAIQQMLKMQMSETNAIKACAKIKVTSQSADKLIISRGLKSKNWYFVINGLVSASSKSSNGSGTSVMLLGPGSWFGEHSIINDKPSFLDYTTLKESDFLVMPGDVLIELAKVDSGFSFSLLKILSWRFQYAGEMLTLLKTGNPALRVMIGLSQFVEALAYHNERPPTIGFGDGLKIPVNQTILANLCGVSRSVLSELIQHLLKNKIVGITYGSIEINNINAWRSFADLKRMEKNQNFNPTIAELIDEFDLMI